MFLNFFNGKKMRNRIWIKKQNLTLLFFLFPDIPQPQDPTPNTMNQQQFQHPDIDFMEDPIAFTTVMLKRELMTDVRLVWRMREMESRYQEYERRMRQLYCHEDDWAPFDMNEEYV